ncbi:Holliday junction recognition protein isoform X1 [Sylvia atricapilla]|uniref:Holliday junction recognition protein isoform X1 n=1 Tax=Sylvia atricapilla TaxID=48155 RepID=UPI003390AE06
MERNEAVQRGLKRSNDRFVVSMNRILQQYNRPFEDDLLVSMSTLTYQTPDGLKQWENVSMKDVKKWKEEILKKSQRTGSVILKMNTHLYIRFWREMMDKS